jgi:hypothetical protein
MQAPQLKAPKTLELIVEINYALSSRGMTREDFRVKLNEHLADNRKIQSNHAGMVKLVRWLNPQGRGWCEPQGEIVIAMQLALRKILANND